MLRLTRIGRSHPSQFHSGLRSMGNRLVFECQNQKRAIFDFFWFYSLVLHKGRLLAGLRASFKRQKFPPCEKLICNELHVDISIDKDQTSLEFELCSVINFPLSSSIRRKFYALYRLSVSQRLSRIVQLTAN